MQPQTDALSCLTYTYAPNWFRYQCLHIDGQQTLYYASNYTLYEHDLNNRCIKRDLSIRNIAMRNKNQGINSKNLKIQAIETLKNSDNKGSIIVAINQPYLLIFSQESFDLQKILKIDGFQNGAQGILVLNQSNSFMIWNEDTQIWTIQFPELNPKPRHKSEYKIKELRKFTISGKQCILLVSPRGNLQIFSPQFQLISSLTPQQLKFNQEHILCLDFIITKTLMLVSILSRNKTNSTYLHHFHLQFQQQNYKFNLKDEEQIHTQIKTVYPKIMFEKIKQANKAAMTIKLLDQQNLLLTGKLGQHFILALSKIRQKLQENKGDSLFIKPHSIDDVPEWMQMSEDSKHYKGIYAVYEINCERKKLIMVGTDQILSEWQIVRKNNTTKLKSLSILKFVTSEAASFFRSEADPKTLFILLRDGIVRSCCPISATSYFLQEYWKFTKKFTILKSVAHPVEPGIIALVAECGKIIVYDVFEDRLIRIIEMDKKITVKNIINITFEYLSIMEPIEVINNCLSAQSKTGKQSWQEQAIKVNTYFEREETVKMGLLIQLNEKYVFVVNGIHSKREEEKKLKYTSFHIRRPCKIERIHNSKMWNEDSLVFSQNKAGILRVWVYLQGKVGLYNQKLKYNGGRCIFKILMVQQQRVLLIFEFKNKKIALTRIYLKNLWLEGQQMQLKEQKQPDDQVRALQIEGPIAAEQLVLDFWSNQLIIYNQKEDILGYLNFQAYLKEETQEKNPKFQCIQMSSKIETVSFYEIEYLAVAFKDQSIKVMSLQYLRNTLKKQ